MQASDVLLRKRKANLADNKYNLNKTNHAAQNKTGPDIPLQFLHMIDSICS